MKKQFARLLQSYIHTSGVKRVYIASVAGISYNYLARLLAGTRNPSNQVVYNLAQALHLTEEQTVELISTAGFVPSVFSSSNLDSKSQDIPGPSSLSSLGEEHNQINRLAHQFYRLALEIPETLQPLLLEEMRCLLSYARYKYVFGGGTPLLDLKLRHPEPLLPKTSPVTNDQTHLDMIAQIIGELHAASYDAEEKATHLAENTLSVIDQLIGNLLSGEISSATYHPQLVAQTLEMLHTGAPWEIRRRIAEALPSLCRLDVTGAKRLMESLRMDFDEIRGPDIRRRVIEALPSLFDSIPQSLPTIIGLLQPRAQDDIYVALAIIEACGDIQVKAKSLLGQKEANPDPHIESLLRESLLEIAKLQRQTLMSWTGDEQECLQFSMALHNLLPAPDTLLLSLEEGLESKQKLVQLVAARYLKRLLPVRPIKTLDLYLLLLRTAHEKNVRRPVAKAVPALIQCLQETSLSTRTLARSVILALLDESDILFHRAVADHAMELFSIDREFLFLLLQRVHKEKDQIIRHRLRPVALRLAQVWLIWYAETAKLIDEPSKSSTYVLKSPFEE